MTNHDRITIDPLVRHGQPVIRGTRTPVARIAGAFRGGDSIEQIAIDYGISVDEVRAAISFDRTNQPKP